jgi:hypothetical protein
MAEEIAGTAPDVAALLADLEACEREAERVAGDLSVAQLNWQPPGPSGGAGRGWSIGQCLDHLRVGAALYLGALRPALAAARERGVLRRGPIRPGPLEGLFVRSMEPPVQLRGRSPRAILPASELAADVLAQFLAAHAEVRATLAAAADLDLNRARFQNPFLRFVKMRTGAGFLVLAAHARRHLWQAARVRQAPGFPR